MNEMQETVETLIDLDEPEALLTTLKRAAQKQKGARWQQLANVLEEAEASLDRRLHRAGATKPVVEEPPVADEAKAE
jgi:hypothetical protein